MTKPASSPLRLYGPLNIAVLPVIAAVVATAAVALVWGKATYLLLILAGLAGCFAIFWHPALGPALILALTPLEDFLRFQGWTAAMLASVLVAAIFAVQVIIRKRLLIDGTALFAAALMTWALTTILWSPDKNAGVSQWISFVLDGSLYLLLINLIESKEDLKLALWGHVVGGSILSLLVTKAVITHDFARSEFVLGYGINLVSRLMGLSLLLSMMLFELETRFLRRVVLFSAAILAGIGVAVTLSRGTWLGVLAGLLIVGLSGGLKGKSRLPVGKLLVLCLGGLVLTYILRGYVFDQHGLLKLNERFQSGVTLSDSAGGRFSIWRVAWSAFSDAPIVGHGFNSFRYEYTRYLDTGGEVKGAHNAYVLIGCEMGLLGIALFVATLLTVLSKTWKFLLVGVADRRAVAAWCMGLFIYLLVATFVDSAVDRKYMWYTLGLIVTAIRLYGRDRAAERAVLGE